MVMKYGLQSDMHDGQAGWRYGMEHGHDARTCSVDLQKGHDIGHAPFLFLFSCSRNMVMQHGHAEQRDGHEARECNMNMQHEHAAWRHG